MAKSVTDTQQNNDIPLSSIEPDKAPNTTYPTASSSMVLWTPRFISIFALTLALGLSAISLFTQGWQNQYYRAEVILLFETTLIFALWVLVALRSFSSWARLAALFGCIWAFFTDANSIANLFTVSTDLPIIAYLNATTKCALFGCYLGLSLNGVPLRRWDVWFFRGLPIIGGGIIAAAFFFTPVEYRSLQGIASVISAVGLYFSIAIWWLRPSCWRAQPALTFLFGFAPFLLALLSLPQAFDGETNFFFLQLSLLCILLGTLRTLQGEVRQKVNQQE